MKEILDKHLDILVVLIAFLASLLVFLYTRENGVIQLALTIIGTLGGIARQLQKPAQQNFTAEKLNIDDNTLSDQPANQ